MVRDCAVHVFSLRSSSEQRCLGIDPNRDGAAVGFVGSLHCGCQAAFLQAEWPAPVSSAPEETAIGSNAASGKQHTDSLTNTIHHQRSATETINISVLASENCQSGAQARKAAKCGSVSVGRKQHWQSTVRKQNRNAKHRKQDQSGPRKAEQSGHRTCPPPHPRPRAILGT